MMELPEYWLQYPKVKANQADQINFDNLVRKAMNEAGCSNIEYSLAAPKWKFLNYLVEKHNIVLHGSGNPNIKMFEPRKADDINEFGSQKAVYSAADGIWAMFFAVIDRDKYPLVVSNACIQFVDGDAPVGDPYYMFSISQGFLNKKPWRTGVVYLLPSETFVEQSAIQFGEYKVRIKQQASLVAVEPIAKLEVGPTDFPFLDQIREHDDSRMEAYANAMQTGGAWPD
jgi:hypothetical protein